MTVSWDETTGLQVFVDGRLVTSTTQYRLHAPQSIRDENVYIGRPNRVTPGRYGDFTIDELEVWYANIDHLKAFDLIDKGNALCIYQCFTLAEMPRILLYEGDILLFCKFYHIWLCFIFKEAPFLNNSTLSINSGHRVLKLAFIFHKFQFVLWERRCSVSIPCFLYFISTRRIPFLLILTWHPCIRKNVSLDHVAPACHNCPFGYFIF